MNKYKTIFFDWDGTAVLSRSASVKEIIEKMIPLLKQNVNLIIISGTSYNNIALGKLHELIPKELQSHIFLGLGRGALNYQLKDGSPIILKDNTPDIETKILIDKVVYQLHEDLFRNYHLKSDILFSRNNYCKLDLMPHHSRDKKLYMDTSEIKMLDEHLNAHHYHEGLSGLISKSIEIGLSFGMRLKTTTDAKYLEVGTTTKTDNIEFFMNHLHLIPQECCFVGDEFSFLAEGILGSDAHMYCSQSAQGTFYDVKENPHMLPSYVKSLKGGVPRFLSFLEEQATL